MAYAIWRTPGFVQTRNYVQLETESYLKIKFPEFSLMPLIFRQSSTFRHHKHYRLISIVRILSASFENQRYLIVGRRKKSKNF